MLPEEKRRMLKYGMRAPLAPLLAEQIFECERLVKEGLMALGDEGYVTTEAGRQLYNKEMSRMEHLVLAQNDAREKSLH